MRKGTILAALALALAGCSLTIDPNSVKRPIPCAAGQIVCNGTCTAVATDNANCGTCGHVCGLAQTCSSGACACNAAGQSICSGACVNLQTDVLHCGSCTNTCAAGASCNSGTCACAAGTNLCGNACVNFQSDMQHCGNCTTVCSAGQACNAGFCGTPTHQVEGGLSDGGAAMSSAGYRAGGNVDSGAPAGDQTSTNHRIEQGSLR
jgi:hypothetical protein